MQTYTNVYTGPEKGYIPTTFSNFGKSVKDLFKKRYEFDHQLKTINRSSRGFTTESGAVLSDSGALRGYIKGTYDDKNGTLEAQLHTDGSQETKANYKIKNLPKGLSFNLLTSTKDKDRAFKRQVAGVESEYSQEYFSSTFTAKSDGDVHKAEASASVGYNGISAGGIVSADLTRGAVLQETNFGCEYAQDDLNVSLWTEKNASFVNAGYIQTINKGHVLGATFKYELGGVHSRSMQLGSEYRLDANTLVKGKVDLPTGDLAANVEHRLADPRALISVSAQFNAKANRFQPEKLGIGLTFGDFK